MSKASLSPITTSYLPFHGNISVAHDAERLEHKVSARLEHARACRVIPREASRDFHVIWLTFLVKFLLVCLIVLFLVVSYFSPPRSMCHHLVAATRYLL